MAPPFVRAALPVDLRRAHLTIHLGSLLAEWADMPRDRRRKLVIAAAERLLGADQAWTTRVPVEGGEREIGARTREDVPKRLRELERDAALAALLQGSRATLEVSEERVIPGLAAIAAFMGSDGPKAREARRIWENAMKQRKASS